ncbi:DNA helicase PcrA [Virgibacillus halodenitrificans]|uniref:DNA helicase PcrA n=1 Tax=Virgibacillus halodenitrificans TaxID=1482 RepID=UPI000EF4BEC2|nr:DNA helicase PcrA [Virgibacillus halodenitrificans]
MIFSSNNLVEGLNPQQRNAVETTEGPLLIMAGAGSGKTRVLTNRIAYLVHKGVRPYNILGITFTNKAAKEMRERVSQVVSSGAEDVWLSTFHSMCVRILRKHIDRIGYTKGFSILDSSDQLNIIKKVMVDELNLDIKKFQPREMLVGISDAKNALITPKKYVKERKEGDFREEIIGMVYEAYQEALQRTHCLDFDDLIMKTVELFKQFPDILSCYQERFRYIHVDEYQDTNHAQYVLVNLLATKYRNLCVVGDSDQAIYGWRGADIKNILSFEKDYSDATTIMLEQNYRSTKTILDAANRVILNNEKRVDKRLKTDNLQGNKINYFNAEDEQEEARHVTETIKRLVDSGERKYSDFAVLYRTNAQSRVIEEVFMKSTISYRMISGTKFYDRMEIKDILAYLRLIANPNDNVSLSRIINVPKRGIGKTSIARIERYARKHRKSMFDSLFEIEEIGVTSRSINKIVEFRDMVQNFIQMQDYIPVTQLVEDLLERTGYCERLKNVGTNEAENRLENIEEFLSITQHFEEDSEDNSLIAFLTDLALISDIDTVDDEEDQVLLMTIHGSKGLEYPVVFLIGMEEGVFPHSRSLLEPEQMEEERRLCYVGITRAEQELHITNAQRRTLYGRTNYNGISRFVNEIPVNLINNENETGNENEEAPIIQNTIDNINPFEEKEEETTLWKIGDKVFHRKWGRGILVNVRGKNDATEIDVTFPTVGVRRLLAKFAPIDRL